MAGPSGAAGEGRGASIRERESSARHVPVQKIDLADEARHEAARGPVVDVGRRADLFEAARVHDADSVGHRQRLLLVVRDEDQRHAESALERLQLELHRLPELAVKRAERLVAEQHSRADHDGAGQRDPLLLPAGELPGPPLVVAGQRDLPQRLADALRDLALADAAHAQPEPDILRHRPVRKQRVGLEHHAHVAPMHRHVSEVAPAHHDHALVRLLEPGDHPQRRGLAAAGRAEQREELARPHVEIDRVDRDHLCGEALGDPVEVDGGGSGRRRIHGLVPETRFNARATAGPAERRQVR